MRYLGGPTLLIDIAGLRLLTDPTFDPPGEHPAGARMLTKTLGPVLTPSQLGAVDVVLLSHDQHPDNLDDAGRRFAMSAPLVLSTPAAYRRLGEPVRPLATWEQVDLPTALGTPLRVTAAPARHGPRGCEAQTGEVTGFVLSADGLPTIYVSGDNAALENVDAVRCRFGRIDVAVLYAGAARTELLDGAALTLTSADAAQAVAALDAPCVVPLHFEGWAHFSEGREALRQAFAARGTAHCLRLLDLGELTAV